MIADTAAERMRRARNAQQDWAKLPVAERVRRLRPLRLAIAARTDEIIDLLCEELGKVPMDALTGDVMVTLEHLRFCERNADAVLRPARKGKPAVVYSGTSFKEVREPYGVALVLAPWNYPLQLSVVPTSTALFAGNAVLLKCSEHTPRTAEMIVSLCRDAKLPEGLVQVSCECADGASALLDAAPDFVFFTGSSRTGRMIAERCAAMLIPAVMELGGKDAALVFASCDLERTVRGVTYGAFLNAGQVCVGVKRLYVQRNIFDEFLQKLAAQAHKLCSGKSAESDLNSVVFEPVRARLNAQIDDAMKRGAKLHTDWPAHRSARAVAVLSDVPDDAALLIDESFGPVVCVAPFDNEADAIRLANASEFALSASVWTGDREQGERVALQLHSGTCAINDVIRNIANPEAAFGGNKSSGYGRYHGAEGLKAFSRVKTIMIAERQHATELHWFPFHARTFARLRAFLTLRHGPGTLATRIRKLMGTLMLIVPLACGLCLAEQGGEGTLAIDVALPPHAHGQIGYLVFAKPDGFPDQRTSAMLHGFVPIAKPNAATQHVELGRIPAGRYAVSLYLDLNGNGKLDKNWMGIPKEPVGASDNPKNRMRAPHFDECVFSHGDSSQTIPITLVH